MSKKLPLSAEDCALFQDAVKNVTRLTPNNKIIHSKPKALSRKKPAEKQVKGSIDILLDTEPVDYFSYATVSAEDFLQFARPGLQTRIIRRLRRGEFIVDAVLDLHGLNLAEAQKTLAHFIAHALENHWHCVQIIHGKGSRSDQLAPPLKNAINHWLRTYKVVLAFCSCQISAGGTGAVYALLKSL